MALERKYGLVNANFAPSGRFSLRGVFRWRDRRVSLAGPAASWACALLALALTGVGWPVVGGRWLLLIASTFPVCVTHTKNQFQGIGVFLRRFPGGVGVCV